MPNTIANLIKSASAELKLSSDSARLDAELLLCHVLNKDHSYLFAWPEYVLKVEELEKFQSLLQKRRGGMPIAYLLGHRDFWTLSLTVSSDTLIPRPETELLVETALGKIPTDQALSILDLGTGTGAVALAVASERPLCDVLAVDISDKALEIARQNAANNQINNVTFLQSNWFNKISKQTFDLILSNPPYIEKNDPHLSQGDVRFEPRLALASGADGFDDIRTIIKHAPNHLRASGWLMFEHGYQQAEHSQALLSQAGFKHVHSLQDLAGHNRITIGQW